MATNPLIISASARRESDTGAFVQTLFRETPAYTLQLLDYPIDHYRYDGNYSKEDQFNEVVDRLLTHDTAVFATPVYWYAMSGHLKVLFDRLTDLVTIKKQIGRKLAGKRMFLIAVGADEELPAGFEEPFRRTAAYFDMKFISTLYCQSYHVRKRNHEQEMFLSSIRENSI
ncbi:NAD(P)H-dependent oxidoreductase [Pontibacter sp. BT731]|uniref:flavodoxin family protein n=1 Tax=Pontibacter coccineus TaxID=3063328 RepID=UPI0026E4087C|nr:NAD(P)H-dependent oxidoreductase [Pontibacter sp. BT731]MDO6391341.1 NAD(P)H-dependent oxidoreductase [Pontibacter sp. BT731]